MIRRFLFVAATLASAVSPAGAQSAPLAETSRNPIGYASPGAALDALHADPGLHFETHDGWVIAHDPDKRVVWTFPPKDDPAWPAVVKRSLVERDGQVSVATAVLCGASKAVCDDFVRKFMKLNEDMARAMAQKRAASAP